jgi:hypothetical protein
MREDPANWNRRIRKERVKEIEDWKRIPEGRYIVSMKTGEKMMEGANSMVALKNAYARAGDNLLFFVREEGSSKIVSVPLYLIYLIVFTAIPLYPIFET